MWRAMKRWESWGKAASENPPFSGLLLRFWNPQKGQILINDIPIQELSLEELHRRIAVLEQDTFLFNCSIADNIAIGKPEASREEIVQACQKSRAA